ncbi:DNA polymerase III subunit epsilon-like protein [Virus Rctr197k]|nr:DNA polymerase III subunit epsilon-like protein [Virus Rctr197k]
MSLPRIVRENRFLVLDVETTGLNTLRDEVVQIAVVQVDHGRPALRASSYVQPKRIISDGALAAHGITWDVLEHAPPLGMVWKDFAALINGRCLLGFGLARFDVPLLSRQLGEHGLLFEHKALDVLPWERKFGGKGKHNLKAAAERWGVPVLAQHDALADCRMTWNVFLQLAQRHPELGEAELDDVLSVLGPTKLPDDLVI